MLWHDCFWSSWCTQLWSQAFGWQLSRHRASWGPLLSSPDRGHRALTGPAAGSQYHRILLSPLCRQQMAQELLCRVVEVRGAATHNLLSQAIAPHGLTLVTPPCHDTEGCSCHCHHPCSEQRLLIKR